LSGDGGTVGSAVVSVASGALQGRSGGYQDNRTPEIVVTPNGRRTRGESTITSRIGYGGAE